MDDRWGFEEDDAEPDDLPVAGEELLTGEDADGIVTVTVDYAAGVRTVQLGDGWQDAAARRGLGGKVVDAMSAAITRVIARQAERMDAPPEPASGSTGDEPITAEHVMRLMHTVTKDLGQFRQRLSAVVGEKVRVTSGGGHVTVSGQRQQVGDVSIDQDWLYGARASEVESELREALVAFGDRSEPGELAGGPRSSAISELMALVSAPPAMVRRIRQGNGL